MKNSFVDLSKTKQGGQTFDLEKPVQLEENQEDIPSPIIRSVQQEMSPSHELRGFPPHLGENSSSIEYEMLEHHCQVDYETTQIKKPNQHQQNQSDERHDVCFQIKSENRLVKKFIQRLMKNAYIFKGLQFNSFQRMIFNESNFISKEEKLGSVEIQFNLLSDVIFGLINIILLILIPYQIGFQVEINLKLSWSILAVLFLELLISSLNSMKQQKNLKNLLRSITIDIISAICFIFIEYNDKLNVYQLFFLFLFLICGIRKMKKTLTFWLDFTIYDSKACVLIFKISLIIHFAACVWHFIGIKQSNSWIQTLDISEQEEQVTLYFYSIYWSISQLFHVGQVKIISNTKMEISYQIVIIFISFWISFDILQHISQTMIQNKSKSNLINLKVMNDFFDRNNISKTLQRKIRQKLRDQSNLQMECQKFQQILQQIPKDLKDNLEQEIIKNLIKSCKLLQKFSNATHKQLSSIIETCCYEANQVISQNNCLYFIENGKAEKQEQLKIITQLKNNQSFGEYNFITGKQIQIQYKTIEQTQLYFIRQEQFEKIIQLNKDDHEKYMLIKHSLLNENYKIIKMYCYSCGSFNHLIQQCPILNYKPNIIRLIQKKRFGQQERQKYKRLNNKQNNRIFTCLQNNDQALNLLRMKLNLCLSEESSEFQQNDIEHTDTSLFRLGDQLFSNISYNKANENQNGTFVHILKSQDQAVDSQQIQQKSDEENDDILKIKPNISQATITTPQFFNDQQQNALQWRYKLSIASNERTTKRNSMTQFDTPTQPHFIYENPVLAAKQKERQAIDKSKKGSQRQISSQKCIDKAKNLFKIYEENSDLQSISNGTSEDQISGQQTKNLRISSNSYPSRTAPNSKQSQQISSKQSSLLQNIDTITNQKQQIIPLFQSYNQSYQNELIDLSNFDLKHSIEEFDNMSQYSLYYPNWNYKEVIQKVNNQIQSRRYNSKNIKI